MLCLKYFMDAESLQKILTNTHFADDVTYLPQDPWMQAILTDISL